MASIFSGLVFLSARGNTKFVVRPSVLWFYLAATCRGSFSVHLPRKDLDRLPAPGKGRGFPLSPIEVFVGAQQLFPPSAGYQCNGAGGDH